MRLVKDQEPGDAARVGGGLIGLLLADLVGDPFHETTGGAAEDTVRGVIAESRQWVKSSSVLPHLSHEACSLEAGWLLLSSGIGNIVRKIVQHPSREI